MRSMTLKPRFGADQIRFHSRRQLKTSSPEGTRSGLRRSSAGAAGAREALGRYLLMGHRPTCGGARLG
jgi:hypothetical protein